ncbi:cysteine--tRNA ligase [Corallococcus sp. CAG:1435]|uniref:Cysteine--tRNA ligase n=1 Tax=Candidatus Fimimonas gallinarum TaxID=2840821 RepID=A0A9D1E4R5_9BACT|nr:cysteine--tRNA ligase [Corallococcus sp. CAG:1435]HIR66122.1 cysteine--tRNA ligase [Candidatus Fimimonas gallinarum]
MQLRFYNTLTRKKEDFVPVKPHQAGIYSCGPTVYKYAHIGNLRAYVFMDELRRVLEYNGYKVKSVMNITDVGHLVSDADDGEDKMSKSAHETGKTPLEIASFYTDQFMKDIDALNIKRPTVCPKATDNIPEMIAVVQSLLDKGYAYETEDGIYFSVEKFPDYGKLSGINLADQRHGARVEVNSFKRHPVDFALWKKAAPNHLQQWDSPWGKGFPGWHIECTAMSKKYLGEVFDIHTGGVDHIPIHHENEIAQAECWLGHPAVHYWMHSEFMLIDGGKMSKSLGNTYTISDLVAKGYSPVVFRYFCLNVQYRQKINFTWEAMDAAKAAYNKLCAQLVSHKNSPARTEKSILDDFHNKFEEAINDDLNIPLAIGVLWTMLKLPKSCDVYKLALDFDRVFALDFDKVKEEKKEIVIPDNVRQLAETRLQARKAKNWAESDRLREELSALGYSVKDTADGYELSEK